MIDWELGEGQTYAGEVAVTTKVAALILVALGLSGCLSNKGSDMAECKEHEAERVRACMEERGYSYGAGLLCSNSVEDVRCYAGG